MSVFYIFLVFTIECNKSMYRPHFQQTKFILWDLSLTAEFIKCFIFCGKKKKTIWSGDSQPMMFHRNVCSLSTDYTDLHFKRQNFSKSLL